MRSKLKWTNNLFLLCTLFFTCIVSNSFAGHIQGGAIKYKFLSGNSVYISVSLYRNCSGGPYSSPTEIVTIGCGTTSNPYTLVHTPFVAPKPVKFGGPYAGIANFAITGKEVAEVCNDVLDPGNLNNSTPCRSGTSGGKSYIRYDYSALLNLTRCDSMYFVYDPVTGGRPPKNISDANRVYIGYINALTANPTEMPDLHQNVNRYSSACLGQRQQITLGYTNTTRDSIRYVPSCTYRSATLCSDAPAAYGGAGNGGLIQSTITDFDSLTGHFSFVPATVGLFTYAFWVEQYEACTGKLISKMLVDQSIDVTACTNNNVPIYKSTSIAGSLARIDSAHFDLCSGGSFTLIDTIQDSNNDTLHLWSNFEQIFPGGKATIEQLDTNTAIVKLTAKALVGNNLRKAFFYKVSDDHCSIAGILNRDITIIAKNNAIIDNNGIDKICLGDSIQLKSVTKGALKASWRVIYGDSIITTGVGKNAHYSDTSSKMTLNYYPNQTSLVEMTITKLDSCAGSLCSFKDTVKVQVANRFSLTITGDSSYCYSDTANLKATIDSNFRFTYQWKLDASAGRLDSSSLVFNTKKSTLVELEVKSDSGCVQQAQKWIGIREGVLSPMVVAACDTTCANSRVATEVYFDTNACNTNLIQGCNGINYYGDTTSTTFNLIDNKQSGAWPSPFPKGNNSRQQYLYSYNDLRSMGILNGGLINSIGFYVDSLPSATTLDLAIRMGCTEDSTISGFVSNTSVVYTNSSYVVKRGWNVIDFDLSYRIPNGKGVVVEWCTKSLLGSLNARVKMKVRSRNVTIAAYGGSVRCNTSVLALVQATYQPVAMFNVCKNPDLNNYTYKWSPGNQFVDSTTRIAYFNAGNSSQTLTVTILDTSTKCTTSMLKRIVVGPIGQLNIQNDTIACLYQAIRLNPRISGGKLKGTYHWSPGHLVSDSTALNPTYRLTKKETLKLNITNQCGCSLSDSIAINVRALPQTPLLTPAAVCQGDTNFILTSKSGTGVFKGRAVHSGRGSLNTLHPHILTRYNHIDSVRITFTDTNKYCSKDTLFRIAILPRFDTILTTDTTFCENTPQTVLSTRHNGGRWSGTGISTDGKFDPDMAGAGTHTIRVDSSGACGNSATYRIKVRGVKYVDFDLENYCIENGCTGIIDTLIPNYPGGQWKGTVWNGVDSTGIIDICKLSYISYPVQYKLIDSLTGCSDSLSKTFKVNFNDLIISLDTAYAYCGKGQVTIDPGANNNSGYVWSSGDKTQKITVTGGDQGKYTVTVSSTLKGNCKLSKSTNVRYEETCLSVEEQMMQSLEWNVYPSPAKEHVFISIVGNAPSSYQGRIIDGLGKEILRFNGTGNQTKINVSDFSDGIYFVEIMGAQISRYAKFVVKH